MTPAERSNLEYTYQNLAALMERGDIRQAEMDELYRIDDLLRPIWTQEQADYEQQMADAPKGYQFGDVGARAGNETLSAAGDVLENAGNVTRGALPESMQPYLSPAWGRIPDIGLAGLLGLVGGVEKGVGYGAEVVDAGARGIMDMLGVTPRYAPGTGAEVLAGDILGGLEVTGVGPEARALGALGRAATTDARGKIASTARNFIADERGSVPVPGFRPPSAVSAPEQRAADIVDLLGSGRADEVTEGMLDLGDPVLNARLNEALWQNYDLPMDTASRMERAKAMGFGDDPKYHGSHAADISGFDAKRLGEQFNNKASKSGFWSSQNPDDAEFYGPIAYPVMLAGKYAELPSMEQMYAGVMATLKSTKQKMEKDFFGEKYSSEAETRLNRLLDVMENDYPPNLFTDIASSNISKAKGSGFDGAVLRGGETVQDVSAAGDNYVTFDPTKIRSRFARFDPRLAHLKNLNAALAGGVGAPIGLLMMQPNEEQY